MIVLKLIKADKIMANSDIEPDFFGMKCTGKNLNKVARYQSEIQARNLLVGFFKLNRRDQLIMAAAATEMTIKR